MQTNSSIQFFDFGADSDVSMAGDIGTFFAYVPIHVVEVGCFVTTDLVPGAASRELVEFDITSASVGVPGAAETTAPTRGSSSFSLTGPSTNVTVRDGKCIYERCDFTVAKGETLIAQGLAVATSGAIRCYMLYHTLGQGAVVENNQEGGAAPQA